MARSTLNLSECITAGARNLLLSVMFALQWLPLAECNLTIFSAEDISGLYARGPDSDLDPDEAPRRRLLPAPKSVSSGSPSKLHGPLRRRPQGRQTRPSQPASQPDRSPFFPLPSSTPRTSSHTPTAYARSCTTRGSHRRPALSPDKRACSFNLCYFQPIRPSDPRPSSKPWRAVTSETRRGRRTSRPRLLR